MELAAEMKTTKVTWRALLHLLAAGNLSILLYMLISNQDTLALALMAILLLGLGLLRFRNGLLGVVVVGLLSADIAFWTLSGAINNFLNGEHLSALLLPAYLGLISSSSIIAAGGVWRARRNPERSMAAAQSFGLFLVAILLIISLVALIQRPSEIEVATAADVALVTEGMKFDNVELTSAAGAVTLELANKDLWWHTFTIDELGVDLRVPMGAERSETFNAEPGTYRFYCAIPGHDAAGMSGTITIQ